MRSFIIVSMVAFGLVVGGCGGGDEADDKGSSKEAASADEFCDSLCTKTSSCDASVDKDVCKNQCRRGGGVEFERLRSDYTKAVQACIESKDCAAVLDADVGEVCSSEEAARLATTPAIETFCQRASAAVKQCDGTSFDVAGCYSFVKKLNDGALAEATACFDKGCTAYNACLEASIDVTID
jgi:hypothetical protein